jgi:hypothetical protein
MAGTQGRHAGRRADEQLGGSASKSGWTDGKGRWKVDKTDGLVGHANWEVRQAEKLGRTCKTATGGRERHGLCSQGWVSTAGR